MNKKVLVVIDMQEDFVRGALGSKEAEAIVENVKKKIDLYRENGNVIVFTRDTHNEDYMETQEGKNLPVPHCIEGTDGWQIIPELDVRRPNEAIYDKPTFGSITLMDEIIRHHYSHNIEDITLIGLCTDICVISNAMLLKAALTEIPIIVDASCCAGVTPESHKNALEAMKMCQIKIVGE